MTLIFLDNIVKSWSNVGHTAGGVARCSTYLFPLRSPGSNPPFRGFGLYGIPRLSGHTDSLIRSVHNPVPDQGRALVCIGENCRFLGEQ